MQPGERVRSRGGGGEVRCVDVPVDRLALPTNAPVVVDTEVSADADEPGLKVGAPVKRVERLVELQEDFLTQIFSLLVSADEFVGDIENALVVGVDDLVSGRLIPVKARLDESIRGTGLGGRGVHGYAGEGYRGTEGGIIASRFLDCQTSAAYNVGFTESWSVPWTRTCDRPPP